MNLLDAIPLEASPAALTQLDSFRPLDLQVHLNWLRPTLASNISQVMSEPQHPPLINLDPNMHLILQNHASAGGKGPVFIFRRS